MAPKFNFLLLSLVLTVIHTIDAKSIELEETKLQHPNLSRQLGDELSKNKDQPENDPLKKGHQPENDSRKKDQLEDGSTKKHQPENDSTKKHQPEDDSPVKDQLEKSELENRKDSNCECVMDSGDDDDDDVGEILEITDILPIEEGENLEVDDHGIISERIVTDRVIFNGEHGLTSMTLKKHHIKFGTLE